MTVKNTIKLTGLLLTLLVIPSFGQATFTLAEIDKIIKSEKTITAFEILSKKEFKIVRYDNAGQETWEYQLKQDENDITSIQFKISDITKMNQKQGWDFGWFNRIDISPPDIFWHPNSSLDIYWPIKYEAYFEKLKSEISRRNIDQSSVFNDGLMTYVYSFKTEGIPITYKMYKSNDQLGLSISYRDPNKVKEIIRLYEKNKKLKDHHIQDIRNKSTTLNTNICNCNEFLQLSRSNDLYWFCEDELARKFQIKTDYYDELYGFYMHDYSFEYAFDRKPELKEEVDNFFINNCNSKLVESSTPDYPNNSRDNTKSEIFQIPFRTSGNVVIVTSNMCGVDFNYILDSGAVDVTINKSMEALFIECGLLNKSNYLKPEKYILADGKERIFRRVIIPKLKIGSLLFNDVISAIVDDNSPLLLGKGILDRFTSWKIDNIKQLIEVKID